MDLKPNEYLVDAVIHQWLSPEFWTSDATMAQAISAFLLLNAFMGTAVIAVLILRYFRRVITDAFSPRVAVPTQGKTQTHDDAA